MAPIPMNTGFRSFSYALDSWTTLDQSAYFLDYPAFELFISFSVFDICLGLLCGCMAHPFTQGLKVYAMLIAVGSISTSDIVKGAEYCVSESSLHMIQSVFECTVCIMDKRKTKRFDASIEIATKKW